MPDAPARAMAPADLHAVRRRQATHALLDVRERGEFNFGQIPGATPLPRGLLELRVEALVPRRDVPVVVYGDDGQHSALAAQTLAAMGYTAIAVLAGGLAAWTAAGLALAEGLDGADVGLAEVKGDVEVVSRRGLLERSRGDMERYLA